MVVNPARLGEAWQCVCLGAAGVVSVSLGGIVREWRERGRFAEGRTPPDLMGYLDIVALATVCDVVPLVGLNRAFVRQGLKVMAERRHPGLTKLADVAGMNAAPNVYAFGFLLGPRINAAGRIGGSGLGVKLLACNNSDEAAGLALRLDEMNRELKQIAESLRDSAIHHTSPINHPVFILHARTWPDSVSDILAGRDS